jgi:hypothetical protein
MPSPTTKQVLADMDGIAQEPQQVETVERLRLPRLELRLRLRYEVRTHSALCLCRASPGSWERASTARILPRHHDYEHLHQ